jgi:hypothetical protein
MMQGLVFDASASATVHAGHAMHEMAAKDHGGHEHAGIGAPVASDLAMDADVDGAGSLSQHHGKFTCSACAACSIALALPSRFELPDAPSTAQVLRPSPIASDTSPQPDRLDRPPRAVLA